MGRAGEYVLGGREGMTRGRKEGGVGLGWLGKDRVWVQGLQGLGWAVNGWRGNEAGQAGGGQRGLRGAGFGRGTGDPKPGGAFLQDRT
eukprot:5066727-Karenia_brevis.AAC.1